MPDTRNELRDFDFCLSLSEKAISSMFARSWDTWLARAQLRFGSEKKDYLSIHPDAKPGEREPLGMEAEVGSPVLHVVPGDHHDVILDLSLTEVNVRYPQVDGPARQVILTSPVKIRIPARLMSHEVDIARLYEIDQRVGDAARHAMGKTALPDSLFSIEALYVHLGVNAIGDQLEVSSPELAGNPEIQREIRRCLGKLFDEPSGPPSLGALVRRRADKDRPPPTFAVTDCLVRGMATGGTGEICYLGMFGGMAPNTFEAVKAQAKEPWTDPQKLTGKTSLIAGTMVINRAYFVQHFLQPKLEMSFARMREVGSGGNSTQSQVLQGVGQIAFKQWTERNIAMENSDFRFTHNEKMYWDVETGPDFDNHRLAIPGATPSSHVGKGSTRIVVQGRADARTDTHHTQFMFWKGIVDDGHVHTLVGFEGGCAFSGEIHFNEQSSIQVANGRSIAQYHLRPTLRFWREEPTVTRTYLKGAGDFWSSIGSALGGGKSQVEVLTDRFTSIVNELKNSFEQSLNALSIELNQEAFIPPGGGVLNLRDFRFSSTTGDLVFDVTYQEA